MNLLLQNRRSGKPFETFARGTALRQPSFYRKKEESNGLQGATSGIKKQVV